VSSNSWGTGPQTLRKCSTKELRKGILFGLPAYLSQFLCTGPNDSRKDLTKRSSCLLSKVDAYFTNDKMCEITSEEFLLNLITFLLNSGGKGVEMPECPQ
jgi:hypothetical protein